MTLNEKRQLLTQLEFIHTRLTQTSQYFIHEFDIAKATIQTVTSQFKALEKDIADELNRLSEANNEPTSKES